MYPIPPTEKLVETKNCRHCGVSFPITDKDLEFYEKVSPVFNGQKYPIPTPTLCPDCRQQRRLSFRNERKLYKRKCDATGRDIISIYSPDKPFKVYHQDFWWSDKWDPMDYGRDFDFERGFFEQFGELMSMVPKMNLLNDGPGSPNSEYCQGSSMLKNCYFVSTSTKSQYCMYSGSQCIECENVIDSSYIYRSTESYECVYCTNTLYSTHLFHCSDCSNCHYSRDLKGCEYCFCCTNLRNKKYCIFNKEYSPEEYKRITTNLKSDIKNTLRKYTELSIHSPFLSSTNIQSENATGNGIMQSKNVENSYDLGEGEDIKNIFEGINMKNCYDLSFCGFSELCLEDIDPDGGFHILYSSICWDNCREIYYSFDCFSCQNCFACIGLRNKSYCILNKQYTKEEYEALVPKIIEHMRKTGEWGEFLPSSLSPFGYNETVAMEYYPISREEIIPPTPLSKGGSDEGAGGFVHVSVFNWSDYEAPFPRVEKIIPATKLPEDIAKIPDDILNWAIECEVTGKPFRIIKQELEFYRKHNLPIPRRHPDQRHLDRMALRNPRKLFERKCDKCGVEMMTTFAPERPEAVYCEGCYNKEIL